MNLSKRSRDKELISGVLTKDITMNLSERSYNKTINLSERNVDKGLLSEAPTKDNNHDDIDIYNRYNRLTNKNRLNSHLFRMKILKKMINMNKNINKYITYTENLYFINNVCMVTITICIFIVI